MTREELQVLAHLVEHCCTTETRNDGVMFVGSSAIPERAAAIRLLVKHDLMEVGFDVGRNIMARWTSLGNEIRGAG
jgi:hypothetical protein